MQFCKFMKQLWLKIKKLALSQPGGFNMIEILIMISLLVLTFVAVMSLIIKNIQMEQIIKNDFVAMSLAKEGLELVEEMRNENLRGALPPFSNISNGLEGIPYNFRIDYFLGMASILPMPSGLDDNSSILKFNDTDYYQYTGTGVGQEPSQFRRNITTVYFNDGQVNRYLKVTSSVAWDYKGQRQIYDISTLLFDDNYNINPY